MKICKLTVEILDVDLHKLDRLIDAAHGGPRGFNRKACRKIEGTICLSRGIRIAFARLTEKEASAKKGGAK